MIDPFEKLNEALKGWVDDVHQEYQVTATPVRTPLFTTSGLRPRPEPPCCTDCQSGAYCTCDCHFPDGKPVCDDPWGHAIGECSCSESYVWDVFHDQFPY